MPFSFAPGWVSQHPDEFESLLAQRLRHPTSTRAWKAQFQACADFLEAGLAPGDITVPTLVMHGTADRVVPYRNMDHVAQRLPHAHLETLEGVGHLCWIEEPDRVNDLIARHLKSS